MGIMDDFRKSKEDNKVHTTPPPVGHTVAEILQDKNKSDLFGKLLEKDGQQDLGQRIREGKLEKDDLELLSEYRVEFSKKIAQSERIENLLTEENIIEIARKHPDFAKILDSLTPKKALKVIRNQLKEICFNDEDSFDAIAKPIDIHDSFKNGKDKETSDKVDKLLNDNGITSQEYLDTLAIKDPIEKKEAIKQLAKKYGGLWWNRLNKDLLNNLNTAARSLEDSYAELDKYKSDIGSILFASVSGNDDMRDALSKELLSESAPVATEKKTGFLDAKKETTLDEKEFNEDWERYKTSSDYAGKNTLEQDIVKDMFIAEQKTKYEEKNKKNKGFWASIFAAWLEGNINDKRNTLS
ncbi:hypothetical protein A2641_01500 [Candidatus Nomurabacteria bacterium RIFCSPHIGHO2_01_FULL_37_25]|uniref:Uncharacterized protein n=1 Tax=Candidatus Nomurabacteria bacterium RIFCSPLOWO2_01_FULL_36_16 TaxID=1801767 RepID=A0A1F6WZ41_9BACT|nr:MAG: hypothetical protein A2641_01500 [Candidatus Nomurabacteria bacterium RIFCSPHIGHO2_01_FULL_37_25]OGI75386.1 MAG: hypothetical protein A3D36_02400 [Candidatus Nomurabacteria bacterium RIFCSPHIGHO2_02_FULL_36_29]OGI87133.1 MAG: hypothetical protein A3A91_00495 [Candidatus Nomurabacteria bacterium RIFCSPLOWO2_01_FULL_36_16]OGI97305.1 MAG: hypothetical protein A3I84_00860 [Candidatus Nomurabacteria bacterium RIFCSPLOWO2_02_FULL_36_8]